MRFIISGRLPSLNEFISANRTNVHVGNKMKQDAQMIVTQYIPNMKITKPVMIEYIFYEPNRRRDLDNIASFAIKVIQDALVNKGSLINDGWGQIVGYSVEFYVDKNNPRICVDIHEVED